MGTRVFIGVVTGSAFGCLAIVSLNGIPENMIACWPLATVASAGLLALGVSHRRQADK